MHTRAASRRWSDACAEGWGGWSGPCTRRHTGSGCPRSTSRPRSRARRWPRPSHRRQCRWRGG
uniref:Uncharacterized protein n=1 Tax=uncultured marine virus TaxID=186617 RepID=A0A0F7L7V6_9VIRU|nr:hypothetical protein [uncultured marine virus]